jgi:hypothetical protein
VLINEENILLEAGIEMRLQAELTNDWVVMTVDVCVDTVHPLEDLADKCRERFGERHTYGPISYRSKGFRLSIRGQLTDLAWEHLFVVDVGLYPCHQLLDISRSWHLGGPLVVVVVLPEILESAHI